MKAALVIDDRIDRPGGVQEYVLGLYDFLEKKNHEPLILTSGRYSKKTKKGRRVIGIGKPFEYAANDAQKSFPLLFGEEEKIKKILKREKPDVVHIQGFPGSLGFECLRLSEGVNVMTYLVTTDSILKQVLGKGIFKVWKKRIEKLHGKIAISEVAAASAEKIFPGVYKIIPVGVDLSRFNSRVSKISRFKDGKLNILFVGRLDKRKGIIYLLRAFEYLSQRLPGVRLIVVGEGRQSKEAKDFVSQNGLDNVEFVGRISAEKLPSYYATADIFCSPATHGESFGVVLLEAMASSLPVVAFDNPGYRSVFPKYASQFLVFNRSSPALAQALLFLASNPGLRRKLGQKNRQYVKRFSWEKVGEETLKYYQSLLSKI